VIPAAISRSVRWLPSRAAEQIVSRSHVQARNWKATAGRFAAPKVVLIPTPKGPPRKEPRPDVPTMGVRAPGFTRYVETGPFKRSEKRLPKAALPVEESQWSCR
jgi:hypothetical protein